MSYYTARMSREPGREMPEQDPTVRAFNEEAEREEGEHQAFITRHMGAILGVAVTGLVVVAILSRRKPDAAK